MPTNKLKNQLHLHFIVFIWGFTAILGALISIDAIPLVWFRVFLASAALFIFHKIRGIPFQEKWADLFKFLIGGILVALHWVTFFHAIKISTISTTLITLSSSAFFVVIIKPFFERNKIEVYELILAVITIMGFVIIFRSEQLYTEGILVALASAVLVALFSVYNSRLITSYSGSKIAFYELFFAGVFLTFVLLFKNDFSPEFFMLSGNDWMYLMILAVLCTAYPFVVATNLLKKMSPFTIVLTNNLEPVYGILLALVLFGDKERLSTAFYLGGLIIFSSVLINGIVKSTKFKGRLKSDDR
ncbi:DMT family transporter [Lutimonas saemankumensis]|uniref:DMT family transporter n=1 Tax=Lutimonas saemankumensis TaxID=483016 RepID=UPI001CD1FBB5|nr:DMT family transporter [Lutimonas saemankumensis]MCA0931472.1 DMT family transporter [Lutimonas saemankumensis]